MKTIVNIEIAPTEQAKVTPRELLVDFADATSGWYFLEEESTHYAKEKGVPACVLRHIDTAPFTITDFGLAANTPDRRSTFRLRVIDTIYPQEHLDAESRQATIDRFLTSFRTYIEDRENMAQMHTVEKDLDPEEVTA